MSTNPTQAGQGASASASTSTGPLIGYCHVCDRQVEIDRDSFTCKECNGGFIELFDMDQSNRPTDSTDSGERVESFRLNSESLPNLLPLLLPQLLNPALRQNANQQQATRQAPTRLQLIVPNNFGQTGQEQFDLYGVINNVINDLLDPRRAQGQPQNLHFQAPPIRMFQLHGDLRDYAWGSNGLDTIITQLLNQLENTGPPPASEDQLRNIPQIVISQEDVEKNAQCAICMEDFKLNDKAKKLPCRHLFHEPCIGEWLKLHGTCPVCRKNLNGEDTSQREYVSRPPAPNTENASVSNNPSAETNNNTSANPAPNPSQGSTQPNPNNYYDTMDFD